MTIFLFIYCLKAWIQVFSNRGRLGGKNPPTVLCPFHVLLKTFSFLHTYIDKIQVFFTSYNKECKIYTVKQWTNDRFLSLLITKYIFYFKTQFGLCFKVYNQGMNLCFLFEEFGSFSKTSFTFSYDHLTVTDHTHGTGALYSSLRNDVSQEPSVSV